MVTLVVKRVELEYVILRLARWSDCVGAPVAPPPPPPSPSPADEGTSVPLVRAQGSEGVGNGAVLGDRMMIFLGGLGGDTLGGGGDRGADPEMDEGPSEGGAVGGEVGGEMGWCDGGEVG